MKKLNITKETFEKSKYFKNKYGKLEYVNESGKLFKTNKGKILKFNESDEDEYVDISTVGDLIEWIKKYRVPMDATIRYYADGDYWKGIGEDCIYSKEENQVYLGY